MAPLPTESRIFADRYMRDLRRREAINANRIMPGAKTWIDAIMGIDTCLRKIGSPVKRAALINKMDSCLCDADQDDYAHMIIAGTDRTTSRSAISMFMTFSAGRHPFIAAANEEGVNIKFHGFVTQRNGQGGVVADSELVFISKHALGRLHERGCDLSYDKATSALFCVAVLGFITHRSKKHADGGMVLNYNGLLIIGSMKRAAKRSKLHGHEVQTTVFDVRTVMPDNEVKNIQMLEQGAMASRAVRTWIDSDDHCFDDDQKLADSIPFMPRRDDYVTKSISEYQQEQAKS